MPGQRLDKWLWCARLVKTRTSASRLIENGKVRINGARALKPSRSVQEGDVVTATPVGRLFVVRVIGSSERRGSASVARALYEDLTPAQPSSQDGAKVVRIRGPRPTKRDRRRLIALKADIEPMGR